MAGFWIDAGFDGSQILHSIVEEGGGFHSMLEAGDIVLFNVSAGFFAPAVLISIDGWDFRVSYLTREGRQATWQGKPAPLRIVTEAVYKHVISKLAESGHRKDSCGRIRDTPPVLPIWLFRDDRDVSLNPKPRMTNNLIYYDGLWRPRWEGASEEAKSNHLRACLREEGSHWRAGMAQDQQYIDPDGRMAGPSS